MDWMTLFKRGPALPRVPRPPCIPRAPGSAPWDAMHTADPASPTTTGRFSAGSSDQMPVLCLAGAWCGDCVNQCPAFVHFARGSSVIDLRFLDRDARPASPTSWRSTAASARSGGGLPERRWFRGQSLRRANSCQFIASFAVEKPPGSGLAPTGSGSPLRRRPRAPSPSGSSVEVQTLQWILDSPPGSDRNTGIERAEQADLRVPGAECPSRPYDTR